MIDRRQRRGTETDAGERGPFQTERVHERPWESSELERGPFDRRSSRDRRDPGEPVQAEAGSEGEAGDVSEERRRRWGRRKSDVLSAGAKAGLTGRSLLLARRFREPLIGLTLAGVAAPLINAGVNPAGEAARARAATAAEGAATARDLDEEVGDYWAESEEEAVRSQTIEGAVTRYNIDRDLAERIYDYAGKHQIEPDMAYGLVKTESTFRLKAVSHVGARGLTQLMPRTAQWLDPSVSLGDLYDPDVNLDLGFRYLRQLIDKYEGDVDKALTAYNRGPGTVDRILNRGGNPDNGYAGKVLAG